MDDDVSRQYHTGDDSQAPLNQGQFGHGLEELPQVEREEG